jgi:high-affinity iron transporter
MVLKYALGLILVGASASQAIAQDPGAALQRLAATATLAAQEYAIGVQGGIIVSQEEVDEATLFLAEAIRSSEGLPEPHRARAQAGLDSIVRLVESLADPDAVADAVAGLTGSLAQDMGVPLDVVPDAVPALAHGADVYRAQCLSCHGELGAGDGAAAHLQSPPPADLTDRLLLADQSPLDFYRRITIGVAGTSMLAFEDILSEEDRWAVAAYTSTLRLPDPAGNVPPHLWLFGSTARMSDEALSAELAASGRDSSAAAVAAVRRHPGPSGDEEQALAALGRVRSQIDSAYRLAMGGASSLAGEVALNAYISFEAVERRLRSRSPALAANLEGAFATYRGSVAGQRATPQEVRELRTALLGQLDDARDAIATNLSPWQLFVQSFVILLREGVEAILIIGALIAFLVKTGAKERRRDVYYGVGAAVAASLLTAVLIEAVFHMSVAQQELLEGATMVLAAGVLFYVSYWLLSKMEVARWNSFVRGKTQQALVGGSVLALPTVAFLAVYREGFETVLFYKALMVGGGVGAGAPVVAGMVVAAVALAFIYLAITRFGVRIPLKPFFGVTGVFLYYLAFVFAGKGVLELQGAGLLATTYLPWAPVVPALGMYGSLEGLLLQSVLGGLFVVGLLWSFVVAPRRARLIPVPSRAPVEPTPPDPIPDLEGDPDLEKSLVRMDADLAEVRAEIARIRDRVSDSSPQA